MINETAQPTGLGRENPGQHSDQVRRDERFNLPSSVAGQLSTTTHPVTVLIVEDSLVVCERLVALIAGVRGVVIVGQARDGHQAQQLFQQHRPDAVVLDIQLPGITGVDLLPQFKRQHPACVVMVLTTYSFEGLRLRCGKLGADYFFEKGREFERVAEVLGAFNARHRGAMQAPELPASGAIAEDSSVPREQLAAKLPAKQGGNSGAD
ncbi:MAG: response regulator transcription factor [Verrucomicrobiota bacterium]